MTDDKIATLDSQAIRATLLSQACVQGGEGRNAVWTFVENVSVTLGIPITTEDLYESLRKDRCL
jgi:hypothetical protein